MKSEIKSMLIIIFHIKGIAHKEIVLAGQTARLSSPTYPTRLTWAPATFLFPRLKIKLKGCHFEAVEVIDVESQAELNAHTEHDFQDN
jgi:hypothetical protein